MDHRHKQMSYFIILYEEFGNFLGLKFQRIREIFFEAGTWGRGEG